MEKMITIPNLKNKGSVLLFATVLSILLLLLLSSCAPDRKAVFGKVIGETCTTIMDCNEGESCLNGLCVASFTVTSEGISAGGIISSDYVCSDITVGGVAGGEQSSQLTFTNIPSGTQSIVVGIFDEDAMVEGGVYNSNTIIPAWQRPGYEDSPTIHWWFYVPVPAGTTTLTIPAGGPLPANSLVGQNSIDYSVDSNSDFYYPLCPFRFEAHEYWITAVAYDSILPAGTRLGRYNDFGASSQMMLDSILASADMFGYYPCNPLEDSSCVAGVRYAAGRLCNEDMDCWSGYCKSIDGGIGTCYAACGDGYQEIFEACDDGNRNDGDGCSADCQLEPDYLCEVGTNSCEVFSCGQRREIRGTCGVLLCSLDFHGYLGCTTQAYCEALNLGQIEPITIWCDERCRPRNVVPYVVESGMVVGSTPSIGEECGGITATAFCSNTIQDGDETEIDCGGSCPECPMITGCGNGVPDEEETCSSCPVDVQCAAGQECVDGECTGSGSLCGNGGIDGDEQCDSTNLDLNNCVSLNMGFAGGTLRCTSACQFDTTSCTSASVLGNACTLDTQCPTMDCINLKCTDVLNEIGTVLRNSESAAQKIIALAAILRSYFSLGY